MSTINITPASLFDATYGAYSITVSKLDKRAVGCQVLGEMVVWITLTEIDPQQIENDLNVLYAIDELFEAINDSEKAVEIFGSEYIKLWSEDKQYIHIGGGMYVCSLSYSGDLPAEEEPEDEDLNNEAEDESEDRNDFDPWGIGIRRSAFGAECQLDLL